MTLPSDRPSLLFIEDAANPGDYLLLGGVERLSMSLLNSLQKSDSLESGAWRSLAAGAGGRSATLSLSGIFEASLAETQLLQAALNATPVRMRLSGSGGTMESTFLPTRYDRRHDIGGAMTVQLNLESAGPLNFSPD